MAADPAATEPATGEPRWRAEVRFLRRVLIVAAVVVLALLLWRIRSALLLVLGAVVVAVVLDAAAALLERYARLPRKWALPAAGGAILLVLALVALLIGGQLQAQIAELREQLPRAVQSLEERFGLQIPAAVGGGGGQGQGQGGDPLGPGLVDVLPRIAGFGSAVVGALSAVVLAVVGGAFLASDPALYRRGLVKLLPPSQHARAEDLLNTIGRALHQWLKATLIAMALIGVLIALGAWLIGLPAPLALGLFAGLAQFVPVVGAVVGGVPVVLLALTQGGGTALWALGVVVAVQQLESNMITPIVEERLVNIPPALLLFSISAAGAVFGLPGVILAAPLTVVAYVAVKKLYVRQTLGEPVEVPGEQA